MQKRTFPNMKDQIFLKSDKREVTQCGLFSLKLVIFLNACFNEVDVYSIRFVRHSVHPSLHLDLPMPDQFKFTI